MLVSTYGMQISTEEIDESVRLDEVNKMFVLLKNTSIKCFSRELSFRQAELAIKYAWLHHLNGREEIENEN